MHYLSSLCNVFYLSFCLFVILKKSRKKCTIKLYSKTKQNSDSQILKMIFVAKLQIESASETVKTEDTKREKRLKKHETNIDNNRRFQSRLVTAAKIKENSQSSSSNNNSGNIMVTATTTSAMMAVTTFVYCSNISICFTTNNTCTNCCYCCCSCWCTKENKWKTVQHLLSITLLSSTAWLSACLPGCVVTAPSVSLEKT